MKKQKEPNRKIKYQSADPWYLHVILYLIIAVLIIILIKVAIIDPNNAAEKQKYYITESRLRMNNIKAAQILWQKKFGNFTDNIDELINFIKEDKFVDSAVNAVDSATMKSSNPFKPLSHGKFTPDSLKNSPKTFRPYILQIDTSIIFDTTFFRSGNIKNIDTTIIFGTKYFLIDPDEYGTAGNLNNDALKDTSSKE